VTAFTSVGNALRPTFVPARGILARYILLRLLLCTALFSLALISVVDRPWTLLTTQILFYLAAIAYFFMGTSAFLLPAFGTRGWFVWAQLVFDTAMVTALVYLTGSTSSPFFVLYFMNLLAAAWMLPQMGVLIVTLVDALAFTSLIVAGVCDAAGSRRARSVGSDDRASEHCARRCLGQRAVGTDHLGEERADRERRAHAAADRRSRSDPEPGARRHRDGRRHGRHRLGEPGGVRDPRARARATDRRGVPGQTGRRWEHVHARGTQRRFLLCNQTTRRQGGYVVAIEDVTRMRQIEAELAREERLAAVGRLAASLRARDPQPAREPVRAPCKLSWEKNVEPLFRDRPS
jgi:hypothetical protein